MRKKIVIGSLLAVFLLMMVPSISAVEFNKVVESNRSQILEQIRSMDIDELRERIKDLDIGELREKIKSLDIEEIKEAIKELYDESTPYYIGPLALLLFAISESLLTLSVRWWQVRGIDDPMPPLLSRLLFIISQCILYPTIIMVALINYILFGWTYTAEPDV